MTCLDRLIVQQVKLSSTNILGNDPEVKFPPNLPVHSISKETRLLHCNDRLHFSCDHRSCWTEPAYASAGAQLTLLSLTIFPSQTDEKLDSGSCCKPPRRILSTQYLLPSSVGMSLHSRTAAANIQSAQCALLAKPPFSFELPRAASRVLRFACWVVSVPELAEHSK